MLLELVSKAHENLPKAIDEYYIVDALLDNILTCFYGHQIMECLVVKQ
jgi:hypothetical protein